MTYKYSTISTHLDLIMIIWGSETCFEYSELTRTFMHEDTFIAGCCHTLTRRGSHHQSKNSKHSGTQTSLVLTYGTIAGHIVVVVVVVVRKVIKRSRVLVQ